MDRRGFAVGVLSLTVENMLLRLSGIWFRGWIFGQLGSVQMGVYQLVFSVFSLGVTLSASGASFTATRLAAERGPNRKSLRRCMLLSLLVSGGAGLFLFCLAPWLGPLTGGVIPLQLLAPGLPCIAVCACLKGTFLAEGKTLAPMSAELLEQCAGIGLSILLVGRMQDPLCALMLASTLSEGVSCLFMALAYSRQFGRKMSADSPASWRELVRIGGPVAGGAGLRSLLSALENLLIPQGLRALGSRETALTQYGLLQGMAMPILLFPGGLLASASTLLVPELARCSAHGKLGRVRFVAGRAFRMTLCFSFAASACMSVFAGQLCRLFYGNEDAAWLLRILAPLIPLQYVDSVVDGMLKGLDQQSYSLCYNLIDSALRVTWCAVVVPHTGLFGYILLLFFSEIFNASLSITRLLHVADVEIAPAWVLVPAAVCLVVYGWMGP